MDFLEFVGFLVMIALLILPIGKKKEDVDWEEELLSPPKPPPVSKSKSKVPATKSEKLIHDFLESLDIDLEGEEELAPPPPPPPPMLHKKQSYEERKNAEKIKRDAKFAFHSKLEDQHAESKLAEHHLKSNINRRKSNIAFSSVFSFADESEGSKKASRFQEAIQNLGDKRSLLIFSEVLAPPKSLRWEEDEQRF